MELDGAQEVEVHQFWFKRLPEGMYVVRAKVNGADGVRAVAAVSLQVVPGR
jgi:hypothetical protein